MKKLNLKKLKLEAEDVLQRSEMGIIFGGSGSSQVQCDNWPKFRPMEVPFCSQGDILCSVGYPCYNC
tara:strand:+ start:627 stop:827 length:201 start_codon:yes stop_codon:yes gene_type:complete